MSDRVITAALVIVFTVLTFLILAIGQLERHAMYQLHADAENIAEQQWGDVQLASEALEYSNQNNQINVQIVLSGNRSEIESLLMRRTDNSAKVSALMARLRNRVGSKLENDRYHAVVETRNAYIESYHRVSDLVLSGDPVEARNFLTQDTFPRLLKYHSAFKDFAAFQTDEMNQELAKSTTRYAAARRRSGILIILSVLLAVGIAAFVICRISSEMRSRTHAEHVIRKMNDELEERVQARTSELQITVQQLHAEIREREKAEEQIQFLAYYDGLTGLPNRSLLHDRLTVALANSKRHGDKMAVLFLDLDNFKNVNDSLGHSAGDLLLKDVASRLKATVREQDTIARLSGDEFVIALTSIHSEADAAVIAARIISQLDGKYTLQGCDVSVTCSLGISIFPDHANDVDALLKNADAAMYSAKRHGHNNFQLFTTEMNANVTRRLALETGLRRALPNKELFLMYQPQVNIQSGEIVGAEALLRWRHPELGLVPPDQFIPIAESVGLIFSIGAWVLRNACAQAKSWQDEGLSPIPVAVNVSPLQFRQKDFPKLVRSALHETGLSPHYLELELTEGLILSSAEVVMAVLGELKEMGVRLSIDDFGTGYSNLNYLRHFPVYKLKIDRSFVKDIPADLDDSAITETIISMARSLRLKVIAEGVETEQQMSFLRAHHCDELQGYYFSKPLSTDDFTVRLRRSIAAPA